MKITLLLSLIVTLASVNAGFINGGHFTPATNVLSSRTIVGGAVGGGPSSGAFSTAQYAQTVAAPATVHTIITSHPTPNVGYPAGAAAGNSGSGGGNAASQNGGGGNNAATYSNYAYNSGPGGSNAQGGSSSGSGGYGRQGGSSGGAAGQNSGYGSSQSSYYSQRYY